MPYHYGKTMIQQAGEPGHNHAYLLNSSQPQRPAFRPPSYGGRPLGPHSYDPPQPEWLHEETRETSAFASKTVKGKDSPDPTADCDFVNRPELIDFQRTVPPGFYSYTWGKQEQRPLDKFDAKLDKVYDVDYGTKMTVTTAMEQSSRKYAASFQSADRRFKPKKEIHSMAPGSYEPGPGAVSIKDAKRPTYPFKSTTDHSSISKVLKEQNEPPDAIHCRSSL